MEKPKIRYLKKLKELKREANSLENIRYIEFYEEKLKNIQDAESLIKGGKNIKNSNGFKVGDILYASWGYDQTNINFFQVLRTTEKQITLTEIDSSEIYEDSMCGIKKAIKNAFLGKVVYKTASVKPMWKKYYFLEKWMGESKEFTKWA